MELSVGLVLWVLSFAALIVTVALGAILSFHWMRYAMNPFMTTLTFAAYLCVSGALLLTIFGAALSYQI